MNNLSGKNVLIFLILINLLLLIFLFTPYLNVIVLSFILWIIFHPLFNKLLKIVKNESSASFITVVLIFCLIFIPLFFIGLQFFNEIKSYLNDLNNNKNFNIYFNGTDYLKNLFVLFNIDIQEVVSQIFQYFYNISLKVFSKTFNFITTIIFSLFILYYLFRDISSFKDYILKIMPLEKSTTEKLIDNIYINSKSIIFGFLVVALVQGFLAGIGFYFFDIPNAIFWGMITVLAALIPVLGTAITIVPASVYLILNNNLFYAVGLLIWGFFIVGTVDNFLRPYLIGKKSGINPVLIFLSVLGGLSLFGIIGFFIGPLIISLFISLVKIYEENKN
jgi:predicted PurR-regulated permease PerM